VSRILITTWDSLGDLHPMIALGLELRDRGHDIVFTTTEDYRARIKSLGFQFHALRPSVQDKDPEFLAKLMDPKIGPKLVLKDLVLDDVRDMYDDLMAIAQDIDFLVIHEIIYAAPLVAEVPLSKLKRVCV
jgi:rhamnosyltransferase subunit B